MSPCLATRTDALTDSLPLRIAARAKQMIADGVDVVNLSVGEPDFPTPDNIKQAGIDAITDNFTRYTPAAGIPELRAAIADSLNCDHGLKYDPEQVVVTNGGKQAIASTLLALVNPGDEVIYTPPCYTSYIDLIRLAGGKPVALETHQEEGFRVNPDRLNNLINDRTRAVILNTPNNPTGAAYTPDEIRGIGDVLSERDIWVISDEIYEKLRYDGKSHLSFASLDGLKEKTALINGVSKFFSMTGWRIGFLAAPVNLAGAVARIQSQVTGCPSSVSQKAAYEAYTGDSFKAVEMVKAFGRRRDLLAGLLEEVPGIAIHPPEGAFYAFPDVSSYYGKSSGGHKVTDSVSMCNYLLEKHNLSLIPGAAFGADRHVRFSFAASDDTIRLAVERFAHGLAELG